MKFYKSIKKNTNKTYAYYMCNDENLCAGIVAANIVDHASGSLFFHKHKMLDNSTNFKFVKISKQEFKLATLDLHIKFFNQIKSSKPTYKQLKEFSKFIPYLTTIDLRGL